MLTLSYFSLKSIGYASNYSIDNYFFKKEIEGQLRGNQKGWR